MLLDGRSCRDGRAAPALSSSGIGLCLNKSEPVVHNSGSPVVRCRDKPSYRGIASLRARYGYLGNVEGVSPKEPSEGEPEVPGERGPLGVMAMGAILMCICWYSSAGSKYAPLFGFLSRVLRVGDVVQSRLCANQPNALLMR